MNQKIKHLLGAIFMDLIGIFSIIMILHSAWSHSHYGMIVWAISLFVTKHVAKIHTKKYNELNELEPTKKD